LAVFFVAFNHKLNTARLRFLLKKCIAVVFAFFLNLNQSVRQGGHAVVFAFDRKLIIEGVCGKGGEGRTTHK
jgi:hypothetical protein